MSWYIFTHKLLYKQEYMLFQGFCQYSAGSIAPYTDYNGCLDEVALTTGNFSASEYPGFAAFS